MKLFLVLLFNLLVFTNSFIILKELKKELNFVFSVVISLLVSSLLYFFALVFEVNPMFTLVLASFPLIVHLSLKFYRNKSENNISNQILILNKLNKTDLFFIFICLYAFLLFLNKSQKWGLWDAWAIWSLHAEFLFYAVDWKNLFDPSLAWSHADYPLFLPSIIALMWNAMGEISSLVPFIIGFIPYFLIIFFFYNVFENKLFGIICILILISDIGFVTRGASQYADTYLALFMLLSYYGLIQTSKNKQNKLFPVIVGIISSGTMWIKNEGITFYIIFLFLWIFTFFNEKKRILYFVYGSSTIILTVILFKFLLAPANDVISTDNLNLTSKICNPNRILIIYKYFRDYLLYSVPAITFLIITAIFSKTKSNILIAGSILLIFVSYFIVYLFSPYDLLWHLETSFDRLVHQIIPILLLLLVPKLGELFPKNNES